jgi:hypothetical protein
MQVLLVLGAIAFQIRNVSRSKVQLKGGACSSPVLAWDQQELQR